MANNIIVDYLRENRVKYNIFNLKKEILSKGYSEEEFNEALRFLDNKEISESNAVKKAVDGDGKNEEFGFHPKLIEDGKNQAFGVAPKLPVKQGINKNEKYKDLNEFTNKKDKPKKGKWFKIFFWILVSLLFLGALGLLILNYLDIKVFGFNLFEYI